MIRVIIGHRGVGKTSFLERIAAYYLEADRPVWTMNLDEVIEEHEGRTICDLFAEVGETGFRELEKRYFEQCWRMAKSLATTAEGQARPDVWIAVGAGFEGPLPPEAWVIYLRRPSDEQGRIFFNRPRLEPNLSPIEEFRVRRQQREERFQAWADEELLLPEGFTRTHLGEKQYVLRQIEYVGGGRTLMPQDIARMRRKSHWWNRRQSWKDVFWELRDDLLSEDDLNFACRKIPSEQVLLSFRVAEKVAATRKYLKPGMRWDWASELGNCAWGSPSIISFHQRLTGESMAAVLARAQAASTAESMVKLAVPVHSFGELLQGHRWAIQNPRLRSFLPLSPSGRWQWYRLLTRALFAVQFWREGDGPNADQPTLLQWMSCPERAWEFAAVVGDPVGHSYSPAEHGEFFAQQGMPFLPIPMSRHQWEEGALAVLWELGLRFAAVTAPLKVGAFERAARVDKLAASFASVNTLMWDPGEQCWRGGNTDYSGLEVLLADVLGAERLVIWGGGGTLAPLKKLLPQASFYSARSGEPRTGSYKMEDPEVVIWGAGRNADLAKPPANWRPRLVIDLNYTDDSPGREWACQVMAKYKSGIEMFREQARGQRKFWGVCGCQ